MMDPIIFYDLEIMNNNVRSDKERSTKTDKTVLEGQIKTPSALCDNAAVILAVQIRWTEDFTGVVRWFKG